MDIFTPDQWMIVALTFVLGLLIGMFLTAGGRRKWKTRYRDEVTRRETLEKEHREHQKRFDEREKQYRDLETRHDKLVNTRPAVVQERTVVDERPVRNDDLDRR